MRLGREMHDGARPMLRQQSIDHGTGADVLADEDMARVTVQRGQILQVAGIGEFVEIDDRLARGGNPVENEVCADKAGAAGYENHDKSEGTWKTLNDTGKQNKSRERLAPGLRYCG